MNQEKIFLKIPHNELTKAIKQVISNAPPYYIKNKGVKNYTHLQLVLGGNCSIEITGEKGSHIYYSGDSSNVFEKVIVTWKYPWYLIFFTIFTKKSIKEEKEKIDEKAKDFIRSLISQLTKKSYKFFFEGYSYIIRVYDPSINEVVLPDGRICTIKKSEDGSCEVLPRKALLAERFSY